MNHLLHIARATAFAGVMTGCIVWSAAAFAADSDAPPQGVLVVRGADFASPRAVARLKHQVDRVAMTICTADSSNRILMTRDERACYDTARKDGLAQIESRQQQARQQIGRDHSVLLAASQANGNSAN